MFKFKKIASILTTGLMMTTTIALATAANYPAPYVQGGVADVAIVHGGADAQYTDLVAVADITANLQATLASQTALPGTPGTPTITGEVYPLFTSGSPLLLNSTINSVRTTLTESELPEILKDGTFATTTNIGYTQRILLGSYPKIDFAQQPSDDNDPQVGIALGTSPQSQTLYNATVTFDSAVNFTHADSSGEDIELFGQKFTVSSATSTTKIVLLKSSLEVTLTNTNPSAEVVVEGSTYTVELISASDTDANIKVTDSNGNSDSKVVSESNSKTIQGLEVGVDAADENNFQLTATLLIGSSRITLQDGLPMKMGTDEDTVDGTNVAFLSSDGLNNTGSITKLTFQTAAVDSQNDAVVPAQTYVDPIFGSFKVDFTGITYPLTNTDREDIRVVNSGNDKMSVTFESHDGTEPKTVNWVYNKTTSQAAGMDLADNDGDAIIVSENEWVNQSGFVVLASDLEGGLYEVTAISNSSSGTASDDELTIRNVFTGESTTHKADSEGSGTFTLQGRTYNYVYNGANTISNSKAMRVRINQPESTGDIKILFPTIATSKGAKVAFYEPTNVTIDNGDTAGTDVDKLAFQDGDGYTNAEIDISSTSGSVDWNVTIPTGGTTVSINTTAGGSASGAIGKLTYNITFGAQTIGNNESTVYLVSPEGGNIVRPALIIFEEKDDANAYEAMIVTLDAGYDGDSAGIGVTDVIRTWGADSGGLGNEVQLETDTDLYQDMDIWGSLIELDKSDSDQTTARISYPDEQVEALVYVAEESASISGGGVSGGIVSELGSVSVTDNEVASVSNKNLIVVGGSCVNSVAASLLGVADPTCTSGFTSATDVGAGQFLIETFSRSSGKVATLVAGYHALDTTNGAKYLTTEKPDTTVGMKYIGTSATSAELVTSGGA